MKRWFPPAVIAIAVIAVCGLGAVLWRYKSERAEQLRFERGETELVLSNLARVPVQLFKAGKNFGDARPVTSFNGERIRPPAGGYFLKASYPSRSRAPSTANGLTSTPRGIVRTLMRLASRAEVRGTAQASRFFTFPTAIRFSPKSAITTWASESSPGRCHIQRPRKSPRPDAQNSSKSRGASGGHLFQTKSQR